jgi:hypothetical protein
VAFLLLATDRLATVMVLFAGRWFAPPLLFLPRLGINLHLEKKSKLEKFCNLNADN